MDSRNREPEMLARGPPLHQFPPPLPGDHTDIFGNLDVDELSQLLREEEMPARGPPLRQFSRPLPGDHTNIVRPHTSLFSSLMMALQTLREEKMPARGPPLRQFSRPLPGDHTNIVRSEIYKATEAIIRNLSACIDQEMPAFKNLPPRTPVPNMQPQFRLQFINKVRNPSFTTNLVRDDNGSPIKVAIYDTSTQSIISPDNILSSAKVEITVLNAEFVENKGETLSKGEFNQSVLREREKKGPILTGRSRIIQLENGVGTFENIVFNDNSSWTKSGFRLGVMVVSDGEEGYFNGERVQEGVSEPFRVKDRRMKASQKPDRLKLTHKVQSLKKIGKDRAFLLQKKNINTVEDFLKIYYNDEPALREILCIKSESGKEWDSMVEHATQCADEYHTKYNALNNSSRPQQVSMDEEVDILNPINNNINALVRPMEGNLSLSTNGGSSVVGCGSSQQNPSDEDPFEFLDPLGVFGLDHALVHPTEGNLSPSTNGGCSVIGWGSSPQNPSGDFFGEPFC